MSILVQVETQAQIQLVVQLAKEVWTEHYTPIIGGAQVAYMLSKFQSEEAISKQLTEEVEYYLIYLGEEAVGYLSIYPKEDSLFLSKLYVLERSRGLGLAKLAMNFIENRRLELGLDSISLTVNKYNTNSINAYLKMGFVNERALVIDIGEGYIMDDYYLIKR